MTNKTITVSVENDAIDVDAIINDRDVTVVLKDNDEPIQATVGPAISTNE